MKKFVKTFLEKIAVYGEQAAYARLQRMGYTKEVLRKIQENYNV